MSLKPFYTNLSLSKSPENKRKPNIFDVLGGKERDQWHEMG